MKYPELWRPTKYVMSDGKLSASRDEAEVGIASRLIADLVAALYGRHIPKFASGRLLDLGCGKAPLYLIYKDIVSEAVCVDWANSMHHNALLDLEWDLAEPLPFAAQSFNTIVLSDVLEHIPTPESLWAEIDRLLAPGGYLLMNVPFYYWLHETPFDFYRYTEFALRRFVDRSNLELIVLDSIGGAPEIVMDILSKCLIQVPRVGKRLAAVAQACAVFFLRTSFGRRISDSTRQNFPLGYFLVAMKPMVSETLVNSPGPARQESTAQG